MTMKGEPEEHKQEFLIDSFHPHKSWKKLSHYKDYHNKQILNFRLILQTLSLIVFCR